jgi:hypothetical protein
LIFIASSSVTLETGTGTSGCSDKDGVAGVGGAGAATTATVTTTNLGLDLHVELLCNVGRLSNVGCLDIVVGAGDAAATPTTTNLGLDLHVELLCKTLKDIERSAVRISDKDFAVAAVTAATTNLGLDLHIASSSVVGCVPSSARYARCCSPVGRRNMLRRPA